MPSTAQHTPLKTPEDSVTDKAPLADASAAEGPANETGSSPPSGEEVVLVHLSDLHFGRVNTPVVKDLAQDIADLAPTAVIVSGDFTQTGTSGEFKRARAFLKRLRRPIFAVPGNHDIPARNVLDRFVRPYRRYKKYIRNDLAPVVRIGDVALIGVNTARPFLLDWNWSHGSISRRQIDFVTREAKAAADARARIVVAHHPFLPPPDEPATRLVGRASDALAAMSGAGVNLILSGHLHQAYQATPPAAEGVVVEGRPILIAQASTATSTRLRGEPNAYNVIRIAGDGTITVDTRQHTGEGFETMASRR